MNAIININNEVLSAKKSIRDRKDMHSPGLRNIGNYPDIVQATNPGKP